MYSYIHIFWGVAPNSTLVFAKSIFWAVAPKNMPQVGDSQNSALAGSWCDHAEDVVYTEHGSNPQNAFVGANTTSYWIRYLIIYIYIYIYIIICIYIYYIYTHIFWRSHRIAHSRCSHHVLCKEHLWVFAPKNMPQVGDSRNSALAGSWYHAEDVVYKEHGAKPTNVFVGANTRSYCIIYLNIYIYIYMYIYIYIIIYNYMYIFIYLYLYLYIYIYIIFFFISSGGSHRIAHGCSHVRTCHKSATPGTRRSSARCAITRKMLFTKNMVRTPRMCSSV